MHYIQHGLTFIIVIQIYIQLMLWFYFGKVTPMASKYIVTLPSSIVRLTPPSPLGILHCTPAVNTFRIMYLLVDTSKHHTPGDIKRANQQGLSLSMFQEGGWAKVPEKYYLKVVHSGATMEPTWPGVHTNVGWDNYTQLCMYIHRGQEGYLLLCVPNGATMWCLWPQKKGLHAAFNMASRLRIIKTLKHCGLLNLKIPPMKYGWSHSNVHGGQELVLMLCPQKLMEPLTSPWPQRRAACCFQHG